MRGKSNPARLSRMLKHPLKLHALVALLLVALVTAGYARVAGLTFLSDDWAVIRLVTLPDGVTNWPRVLADFYSPLFESSPKYRPFYSLSFGIDYALFGTNPLPYHLVNLTLHAIVSFFVYLLALELVTGERRRGIAVTAGALFALYPIHPESVTWIAGRVDLICAVFYLPAVILFLRWLRTNRGLHLALSLACFALALLSKEMAIVLPGLLFLLALYRSQSLAKTATGVAPFALVLGVYLAGRAYLLSGLTPNSAAGQQIKLLASLQGLIYRTAHSFFPVNLGLLPQGWQSFAWPFFLLVSALALGSLGFAYYRGWARSWMPLLLLALYGVSMVPVFRALRPDPSLVSSRWAYIPSVFLSILIAYFLWRVLPRRLALVASVAVCAAFFAILTVNQGPWLQAGEMTQRYLEEGEKPELPVRYKGAHVFGSEITWAAANRPPFKER